MFLVDVSLFSISNNNILHLRLNFNVYVYIIMMGARRFPDSSFFFYIEILDLVIKGPSFLIINTHCRGLITVHTHRAF